MKVKREGEPAKAKRAGEDKSAEGGAPAKRVCGAAEAEAQPQDPPAITVPAKDDVPDPATYTVITQVDFSAAPMSRQYCETTLNLMEECPDLIVFLVMLKKKVGRVHLTFDSDERNYDEQFRAHVIKVFAVNDMPPFDFEAYVAWPKVKTQIDSLLEGITDKLDEHSFFESLKMPTPEPNPQPWPFFHDCAVKWNDHWAIVVCREDS